MTMINFMKMIGLRFRYSLGSLFILICVLYLFIIYSPHLDTIRKLLLPDNTNSLFVVGLGTIFVYTVIHATSKYIDQFFQELLYNYLYYKYKSLFQKFLSDCITLGSDQSIYIKGLDFVPLSRMHLGLLYAGEDGKLRSGKNETENPIISGALYAINTNFSLAPKEKILLLELLKGVYPKIFITHFEVGVKSVIFSIKSTVPNNTAGEKITINASIAEHPEQPQKNHNPNTSPRIVLNEWLSEKYYKCIASLEQLHQFKKDLNEHFYDSYIWNFVKENY